MTSYLLGGQGTKTPQTVPTSKSQVKNSAGGYVYDVDDFTRLERFLILGAEGGTYYIDQATLVRENAQAVIACIKTDGLRAVEKIKEISWQGRAPKNDPAIYALALATILGNEETRKAAFHAMPDVCRTGTHLLQFIAFREAEGGGWGNGMQKAVANWFSAKPINSAAYQAVKYRQRGGWSMKDALRLSHAFPKTGELNSLYAWITEKEVNTSSLPEIVKGFEEAKKVKTAKAAAKTVTAYKLPREAVPTEYLDSVEVQAALLPDMPATALLRNLGNMSKSGFLAPMSDASVQVVEKLEGIDFKAARVHPISVLNAMLVYASGKGVRGSGTWTPVREVVDKLDDCFYRSFEGIEPTGKRLLVAIDVSGSMHGSNCVGLPHMQAHMGAAAMAMGFLRSETGFFHVTTYDTQIHELPLSPKQRIDDVVRAIQASGRGGTDCAVPIKYAMDMGLTVDAFISFTDSETWAGDQHVTEAMAEYRRKLNPDARMINIQMAANSYRLSDPMDSRSLEVIGFDTTVPQVINDFITH